MAEWRPVPGYEGLYEASSMGDVRSGRRKGSRGGLLRPGITGGKRTVVLYKDGQRITRLVSHLVLEAFAGRRPPGQECRHGPGGGLDDRLVNLRWGWSTDNQGPDRVRDGTSNRGSAQWMSRLTEEAVKDCRRRYASGETQRALAAEYGVHSATLSEAITGVTWHWIPGGVPIDRSRRGTRGAANHNTKLTAEIVADARRRSAAGEYIYALAAEYGVTQATMWKAIRGWTWKST